VKFSLQIILLFLILILQTIANLGYAKPLTQSQIIRNDLQPKMIQAPKVRERIINDLNSNINSQKTLRLKLTELQDSQGLKYLGLNIPKAELVGYLAKMKRIIPAEYAQYRDNQSLRDHGGFHLTLVNPYEYQLLNKTELALGKNFSITLIGLGRVSSENTNKIKVPPHFESTANKKNNTAYYIIANSSDGQFYRQNLLLKPKDFHVTLGFDSKDVYDKSKGVDTLIEDN